MPDPINAVILIEPEPLKGWAGRWLGWMVVLILFVVALIYFSNYFAKDTECLVSSKSPLNNREKLISRTRADYEKKMQVANEAVAASNELIDDEFHDLKSSRNLYSS